MIYSETPTLSCASSAAGWLHRPDRRNDDKVFRVCFFSLPPGTILVCATQVAPSASWCCTS